MEYLDTRLNYKIEFLNKCGEQSPYANLLKICMDDPN